MMKYAVIFVKVFSCSFEHHADENGEKSWHKDTALLYTISY